MRIGRSKSFLSILLVMCMLVVFPGISLGSAQAENEHGNGQGNNQRVIIAATADNGTINVKFNKQPRGGKPEISDFTIQRQVNGGEAEVVAPTSYAWGSPTKIATFAVPPLASGSSELEVVYSVSYKGAEFVSASTFVIPASIEPPLVLVEEGQARAVVVVAEEERNLEEGLPGWNNYAGRTHKQFSIESSNTNSGTYSLMINDAEANKDYGAISDLIEVIPGESYTASVQYFMETDNPASNPVYLLLYYYDANKVRIDTLAGSGKIAEQWSTLSVTRLAPASATYASVLLYTNISGTRNAYFDDAALTQVNGDGSNLLINPGFEEVVYAHDEADTLVEYVEKSTGARLPVMTAEELSAYGNAYDEYARIYIGKGIPSGNADLYNQANELDDEGFVIRTNADGVFIIGPTRRGTGNGVYEFLERYLGIRWLFPGPDGEDVPLFAELTIPREEVVQVPAIQSRTMSPIHYISFGEEQYEWGLRNRLYPRTAGFRHNVYKMFLPSQYGTTNPEYYPLRDGGRYIPSSDGITYGWQPCFSEPATVQVAVDWVLNYFNNNPDQDSVSLAVNDNGGYCEQEADHPHFPGTTNSLGLIDMSDIYYEWVNQVATAVLNVYPDKWFGVLAYQEVNDPPSFELHPRVVPYLTKDRMAWVDSTVLSNGEAMMDAWHAKADNIAYYDYTYGTPYLVPRIYNHHFADYIRLGIDNGLNAYVTEAYPNWGEGPKAWLMSKLLWDPEQNVASLLDEWYVRAVGPEAAADLKAYYDHWEQFWTERIVDSAWFNSRKNTTYLAFNLPAYVNLINAEDIATSRGLLEAVVAKAGTVQQQKRAELILRAFEYYEASVLSFPSIGQVPANETEALQLLDDSLAFQEKLHFAEKRLQLVGEFAEDPFLKHPWSPTKEKNLMWSGWNPNFFWHIIEYMRQQEPSGGPVSNQVSYLEVNGETPEVKNYASMLLNVMNGQFLNANSSFEAGTDAASGWDETILNFGTFERIENPQHVSSGNASVYVHNFYYGSLHQTLPVQPGLITSKFDYFVTQDTNSVGTIFITLNYLDAEGNVLSSVKSESRAFAAVKGVWDQVRIIDMVPDDIDGKTVAQVKLAVTVNGFFEGGTLYLDDFELYQ
ncbi:DUF4838 domain-containing protein [Paenibacillus sp. J5C_2022]|nr:DUF4838 domain-containing protein [Paenibacillus sp. J5C2022]